MQDDYDASRTSNSILRRYASHSSTTMKNLNTYQKLDWISFAIQEALNGNDGELMQALELVEILRDEAEDKEKIL